MLQSKRNPTVMLLITSLLATACSMPKPQDRENSKTDSATFFVHEATVEPTEVTYDKEISLPVSKTFNFKVCIKDSQHSESIKNHEFEISNMEKTIASDSNGCVVWDEKIAYNHLAPAKWISMSRTLAARGFQKGQRIVEFALNPWENQAHSLLEKKRSSLLKAQDAEAALNAETTQGIWIDDLRLTVEEKKVTEDGAVLNFEIRASPSFAVTKTGNQKVLEPITKGQFEAEITLIQVYSENQNEVKKPISKTIQVPGIISNNALLLEAPITLSSAARSGQIQLGLKLTAVGGPKSLGAFHGVFNIGEYDQIKGNSFSRLKNEFQEAQGTKTVEQYLTAGKTSGGKDSTALDNKGSETVAKAKSQVRIRELQLLNVGYKTPQGMSREKVYTVKACMTGPIDSKAIRGHEFKIVKSNGTTENKATNDEGCLTFEDSVSYQFLDSECWVKRPAQISNSSLAFNETLNIVVNPWAEGPSSVRDARQVESQELSCAKGKSKIVLARYDFERGEVEYPIDEFFNIKIRKKGILKLQARLSRPSLTSTSGIEDTPVPPGKYWLRLAIVDASVRDFSKAGGKIYQALEKQVEIEAGGLVNEAIALESANLRAMGNTNSILIELFPENQEDQAKAATYRGYIVLASNVEGSNLESIQEGSESIVKKLMLQFAADEKARLAENQKLAQKENFAKIENLTVLNLNQEAQTAAFRNSLGYALRWQPKADAYLKASQALPTAEIQSWLDSGKLSLNLAKRLCNHWFLDRLHQPQEALGNQAVLHSTMLAQRHAQLCQRKVSVDYPQYFEVQYRYFMQKAVKIKDLDAETKDLTFAHSFALSHSHDEAFSKTLSADVNMGLNTGKWLSPLSIGGGFRYQIAKSETTRQASANAVSIQASESLMLEKLRFQLEAPGYEKCVIVRLNLEILNKAKSPLRGHLNPKLKAEQVQNELQKGLLICDGGIRNKKVNWTESYFVLNQKTFNTQAINPNSDFGRPLFMAVRGERDFRRLMSFLNGRLAAPTHAQSQMHNQQAEGSVLAPVFHLSIPTYPGQYSADQ